MTDAADRRTTAEHRRLAEATGRAEDDLFSANPWYEWGPYLSERAWGTVREDYSESGDAWTSFPHEHARSRAYRWNEDGMAGVSDIRHDLGPDEPTLDVLPTLWFRNTWSWGGGAARPRIERDGTGLTVADHRLAGYRLEAAPGPDGAPAEALFCDNETNAPRLFGSEATTPF